MSRRMLALAALMSASALAACSAEGERASPTPYIQPQAGSACAAEIAEFTGIVENDRTTGNLAGRVYAKIKPELNRADTACKEGRNAKALSMLAATKGRYGYR